MLSGCRYPDLTLDLSATQFVCPYCANFCNCSQCSRARGEEYISERNGGWRKWGTWPAPAAAMTGPSSSSSSLSNRQRRRQQRLVDFANVAGKDKRKGPGVASVATEGLKGASAPELENLRTAVFTVTGEPLGEAFVEGNTARIGPIRPAAPLSMFTSTPRSAPAPPREPLGSITTILPHDRREAPPDLPMYKGGRRQYVFVGKPLKSWGRLVSLPDPEEQKKKTRRRRGARRGHGKHKRVCIRMFVGSEKPLLSGPSKGRRHRSTSLTPSRLDDKEDADEGINHDVDEGIWPGEYIAPPRADVADLALEFKTALRITPEEVERAIGAAFAIGA
jgi:hypothetical protein